MKYLMMVLYAITGYIYAVVFMSLYYQLRDLFVNDVHFQLNDVWVWLIYLLVPAVIISIINVVVDTYSHSEYDEPSIVDLILQPISPSWIVPIMTKGFLWSLVILVLNFLASYNMDRHIIQDAVRSWGLPT